MPASPRRRYYGGGINRPGGIIETGIPASFAGSWFWGGMIKPGEDHWLYGNVREDIAADNMYRALVKSYAKTRGISYDDVPLEKTSGFFALSRLWAAQENERDKRPWLNPSEDLAQNITAAMEKSVRQSARADEANLRYAEYHAALDDAEMRGDFWRGLGAELVVDTVKLGTDPLTLLPGVGAVGATFKLAKGAIVGGRVAIPKTLDIAKTAAVQGAKEAAILTPFIAAHAAADYHMAIRRGIEKDYAQARALSSLSEIIGAGVIRAGGSVAVDLTQPLWRKAADALPMSPKMQPSFGKYNVGYEDQAFAPAFTEKDARAILADGGIKDITPEIFDAHFGDLKDGLFVYKGARNIDDPVLTAARFKYRQGFANWYARSAGGLGDEIPPISKDGVNPALAAAAETEAARSDAAAAARQIIEIRQRQMRAANTENARVAAAETARARARMLGIDPDAPVPRAVAVKNGIPQTKFNHGEQTTILGRAGMNRRKLKKKGVSYFTAGGMLKPDAPARVKNVARKYALPPQNPVSRETLDAANAAVAARFSPQTAPPKGDVPQKRVYTRKQAEMRARALAQRDQRAILPKVDIARYFDAQDGGYVLSDGVAAGDMERLKKMEKTRTFFADDLTEETWTAKEAADIAAVLDGEIDDYFAAADNGNFRLTEDGANAMADSFTDADPNAAGIRKVLPPVLPPRAEDLSPESLAATEDAMNAGRAANPPVGQRTLHGATMENLYQRIVSLAGERQAALRAEYLAEIEKIGAGFDAADWEAFVRRAFGDKTTTMFDDAARAAKIDAAVKEWHGIALKWWNLLWRQGGNTGKAPELKDWNMPHVHLPDFLAKFNDAHEWAAELNRHGAVNRKTENALTGEDLSAGFDMLRDGGGSPKEMFEWHRFIKFTNADGWRKYHAAQGLGVKNVMEKHAEKMGGRRGWLSYFTYEPRKTPPPDKTAAAAAVGKEPHLGELLPAGVKTDAVERLVPEAVLREEPTETPVYVQDGEGLQLVGGAKSAVDGTGDGLVYNADDGVSFGAARAAVILADFRKYKEVHQPFYYAEMLIHGEADNAQKIKEDGDLIAAVADGEVIYQLFGNDKGAFTQFWGFAADNPLAVDLAVAFARAGRRLDADEIKGVFNALADDIPPDAARTIFGDAFALIPPNAAPADIAAAVRRAKTAHQIGIDPAPKMVLGEGGLETPSGAPLAEIEVRNGADIDPMKIGEAPSILQHKVNTDAKTGEKKSGKTVGTKWSRNISGIISIWESKSGDWFVADGHQRLAAAKRAIKNGQKNVRFLAAAIYRDSEGWTPSLTKMMASAKNVASPANTADGEPYLSAAMFFRLLGEDPEVAAFASRYDFNGEFSESVADIVSAGYYLAQLSKEAFDFLENASVANKGHLVQMASAIPQRIHRDRTDWEKEQLDLVKAWVKYRERRPKNLPDAFRRINEQYGTDMSAESGILGFGRDKSNYDQRKQIVDRIEKELRAEIRAARDAAGSRGARQERGGMSKHDREKAAAARVELESDLQTFQVIGLSGRSEVLKPILEKYAAKVKDKSLSVEKAAAEVRAEFDELPNKPRPSAAEVAAFVRATANENIEVEDAIRRALAKNPGAKKPTGRAEADAAAAARADEEAAKKAADAAAEEEAAKKRTDDAQGGENSLLGGTAKSDTIVKRLDETENPAKKAVRASSCFGKVGKK